jgi:Tfp pilus assembly protein PilX
VSGQILAANLVGAQHGPRGAAHLVVLAVLVVIGLVIYGVNQWRAKRASAAAEESTPHKHSAESTDSTEES